MEPSIDVVGIGNALVDVLSHESDDFVAEQGLTKGSMTLIDAQRAENLYASTGPGIEISGGCAANTMVGVASFGGSAVYIGRVRDDPAGPGVRPRSPLDGGGLRRAAGRRRAGHRTLPDPRHPRRPGAP